MSVDLYYDDQADLSLVAGRTVAVIGYGRQGRAHALSLRDSGVDVRVGLPDGSGSRAAAQEQGLPVGTPAEVAAESDLIMLLAPDTAQRAVYAQDLAPHLSPGKALFFGNGLNIRYGLITPPAGVDVAMVAPKGPGHLVRRQFVAGKGVPVLVAVELDATGSAFALALSYAKGIGGTRAGAIATTFAEETETSRFGEQAVAVAALAQAGFEVLTEAGYAPEVAYFECLHELKSTVDLMYESGIAGMRDSRCDTAEFGAYTRGPRIVDGRVKEQMRQVLAEVRSGAFVREWIDEDGAGRPTFRQLRDQAAAHPIEPVGRRLRAMMSWVDQPAGG